MSIVEIFDKSIVDLNMNVKNKEAAIYHLSNLLKDAGYIRDVQEFIDDIYIREEEGLTGIGEHIAIPHGKSESVCNIGIAVGKLDNMIEWGSLDNKPINIIFLFAVSKSSYDKEHLRLLSELAGKLGYSNTIDKLREMKTFEDLIEAFEDKKQLLSEDMEELIDNIEIIVE